MPKVQVKFDHFNNALKRDLKQGDVVEVAAEELKANASLFAEVDSGRRGPPPRDELEKIVIEKKLAKPDEVKGLSYPQLQDLVKKAE